MYLIRRSVSLSVVFTHPPEDGKQNKKNTNYNVHFPKTNNLHATAINPNGTIMTYPDLQVHGKGRAVALERDGHVEAAAARVETVDGRQI